MVVSATTRKPQRRLEATIAQRQPQLLLHGLVQHTAGENEAEAAVENLRHAAADAEHHLPCIRQKGASELATAFLGIDAARQRQVVTAQFVHVVGIENDVSIDPHQFVESLGESVVGHLVACRIDGRVTAHAPDGIAAPLQFAQGIFATGVNGAANRHEDDAARYGEHGNTLSVFHGEGHIQRFPGAPHGESEDGTTFGELSPQNPTENLGSGRLLFLDRSYHVVGAQSGRE
jgi:hypothetical protein